MATPRVVADALDARRGARTASARVAHYGRAFDCAFAPWGRRASDDSTAWDEIIVTCGEDATARVHGVDGRDASVKTLATCRAHREEVVRVAFARATGRFATGSADGTCKVWDFDARERVVREAQSLDGHPGEVYGCCFLGDGDGGVVATCSETEARAWDVERGTTTAKTAPRDDLGTSGARTPERWSPGYLFSMARGDGVLACGCSDGVVRVYGDGSSGTFGERVAEVTAHPNAIVGSTSFIDGGRVLCSVGLDGTVVLTDVRTWGIFRRISAGSTLTSACGVGSGSWLAMVGESGVVRAIDAIGDASSSAQCVFEPKGEPVPLFCVAANESGTMLACSGAGVPSSAPTLGATFGAKTPDPSRLDVWMASSEA